MRADVLGSARRDVPALNDDEDMVDVSVDLRSTFASTPNVRWRYDHFYLLIWIERGEDLSIQAVEKALGQQWILGLSDPSPLAEQKEQGRWSH